MRIGFRLAVVTASVWLGAGAGAQTPTDVPAGHWARPAVLEVVSRGVMRAPGGKFDGGRTVTRTEMAVTLADLARSLEQGKWPKTGRAALKDAPPKGNWKSQPVSRYELAAIYSKMARVIAQGLPKSTGKVYSASDALVKPFQVTGVSKTDPAYPALSYLAKNRMIWPKSPLLKPGSQPVTGEQVAQSLGGMIAGLNDRLTDEPQNREDLGPPPSHKH